MKATKSTAATRSRGIFFAAMLAIILAALFGKSFLPGYVHFANDGPLGQQNAKWTQPPASFSGSWADLSIIGGSAGATALGVTELVRWLFGPIDFAKFLAPIALFILGLGAWTFFRQLRLSPLAATLGALAAVLNSTLFGSACWGVAPQQVALGMDFFALALVVSNSPTTPALIHWARLALAGLAVGMNVIEGADIGAIFSLFVSAFVLWKAFVDETGPVWLKLGRGIGRITIIAVFAGFIAMQTVVTLIGTNIVGVVGMGQDTAAKARHWDEATEWSLPKIEALGLFVPGLFGYRMDTPINMMEFLQNSYRDGSYWGGVGRTPAIDRYFDSGQKNSPPQGMMRFSGEQNYAGILVMLVTAWAVAQSVRRRNSVFLETQRRLIWFWAAVLIGSLLFAFGRFAPFYKFLYMLPYFSTIRNPIKFIHLISWASSILFAYGVHGLSRRYLEVPAANASSPLAQLKKWWMNARGFDRNWTLVCALAVIGSALGWLIYASEKPGLVRYLQTVGFPDEYTAQQVAAFSIGQAGWFVVLFALATGLCVLILAGIFSGKRAKLGGILLGILLVADLGRANLPYIIHWDYQQKYASNPIIDVLRDNPYEHRVVDLRSNSLFENLYRIEWMQQHFPYFNIQSLDLVQMPRFPADLAAYETALNSNGTPESTYLIARHWQLTNTRYLLGPANFLESLNEQLDPALRRFRILQRFDVAPKPGVDVQELNDQLQHGEFHGEKLTAVLNNNGPYALFEFTGALPRAKLYPHWQISTNDSTTLQTLASTNFDAWQTVLVSTPLPVAPAPNATNENSGTVEYKSYAPKDIVFNAKAGAPTVLLLNDKFDPHWQVLVDGKPAELLRCNFIMRGVYLTPGAHTVKFQFNLPNKPFYITLTALGAGLLLCGFLFFSGRRNPAPTVRP